MQSEENQVLDLKVYKAILALRPEAHFTLAGDPTNEADYVAALTWQDEDAPPSWAEIVPLI